MIIILVMVILTSAAHADTYVDACSEFVGPPNGRMASSEGGIPYSKVADGLAAEPQDGRVVIQGSDPVIARPYPESGRLPLVLNKRITVEATGGSAMIGLPGATQKVQQLTGRTDLERNRPTETFRVYPNNGVAGTDLGASFEHNGRIYFLFGDTWPPWPNNDYKQRPEFRPMNSDSIASIDASTDPEQPIALEFITAPDGQYRSPKVLCPGICPDPDGDGPDPEGVLRRAEFEVPLSGFSANGKMYVFFSTDKGEEVENAGDPKYENKHLVYMGRSVLARLKNIGENTFDYMYDVSCLPNRQVPCRRFAEGKFINIAAVVVDNADVPELFQAMGAGRGVLLWGTGRYRRSDPYLAYLPLDKIEERKDGGPEDGGGSALRYAVVAPENNSVSWSQLEHDATELFKQDCFVRDKDGNLVTINGGRDNVPCDKMGELSVAWNPFLRKWIMLYNHGAPGGINYRTAEKPWGKWSAPAVLFDGGCDHGLCHFMHRGGAVPDVFNEYACDSVIDVPAQPDWNQPEDDPPKQPRFTWGGAYGPYIVSAFTRGDADTTTIYWLMSTWNPYQAVLMKSTLRLSDGLRVDQPRR